MTDKAARRNNSVKKYDSRIVIIFFLFRPVIRGSAIRFAIGSRSDRSIPERRSMKVSQSRNCRNNVSGARRSSQALGDQSSARLRARGQPLSVGRSTQEETYGNDLERIFLVRERDSRARFPLAPVFDSLHAIVAACCVANATSGYELKNRMRTR